MGVFEIANQLLTCHSLYLEPWMNSKANKVAFFLLVWGLDNKQNNTWLLGDMEFPLLCSTWYFTHLLPSLVRYQVEQWKITSIFLCAMNNNYYYSWYPLNTTKTYWGLQWHPDLSTYFIGSIQLSLIINIIFVIFSHIILSCITLFSRLFLCLNYSSNCMLKLLEIKWYYVWVLNKVPFLLLRLNSVQSIAVITFWITKSWIIKTKNERKVNVIQFSSIITIPLTTGLLSPKYSKFFQPLFLTTGPTVMHFAHLIMFIMIINYARIIYPTCLRKVGTRGNVSQNNFVSQHVNIK